jgi:hypothetical protein
MLDGQHQLNQTSYLYTAYRGDATGGPNLIYIGIARPGALTSNPVWQIRKLAYDANNNVISMTYAQNPAADAIAEFEFIWDNRAGYTYS